MGQLLLLTGLRVCVDLKVVHSPSPSVLRELFVLRTPLRANLALGGFAWRCGSTAWLFDALHCGCSPLSFIVLVFSNSEYIFWICSVFLGLVIRPLQSYSSSLGTVSPSAPAVFKAVPAECTGSTGVREAQVVCFHSKRKHLLGWSETHLGVPISFLPSSPSQSCRKQKKVPRRCSSTAFSLIVHNRWPVGLEDVLAGFGFSSELGIIQNRCIYSDYLASDEPDEQVLSSLLPSSLHCVAFGEKSWMKYIGSQFWVTQLGRKRPDFQIFFNIFRSLMAAEVSGATCMRKIYEDISWSILCDENSRKTRWSRCNAL